jgi:diguanylate cyclase (GGDEF)-like protein
VELDIDNFKVFNDRFGHQVGDEVLLAFSRTMEQAFKQGFVSRFGGDEFLALFCGDVTREQVHQAISRFQHLLKEKSLSMQTGRVNSSIGIAYDSTGVVPIDDLYQRADQALYAAKHRGKNCVVEWNSELRKELAELEE